MHRSGTLPKDNEMLTHCSEEKCSKFRRRRLRTPLTLLIDFAGVATALDIDTVAAISPQRKDDVSLVKPLFAFSTNRDPSS